MAEIISNLFRLPANGKPMTVMQLAGFPAEVVDSVVSVLCRMAFDFGLWSDGVAPLLFVCEEAHRYAPADSAWALAPTRRALSRIAKEGRKYGVFLGLVTQRPAEIDATIISQCNTLFVMRMSNDRDQALIRSAVSDAASDLADLRAVARHRRGVRVRIGRRAADADELQGIAEGVAAVERSRPRLARRCRHRRRRRSDRVRDRSLAQLDHEPEKSRRRAATIPACRCATRRRRCSRSHMQQPQRLGLEQRSRLAEAAARRRRSASTDHARTSFR